MRIDVQRIFNAIATEIQAVAYDLDVNVEIHDQLLYLEHKARPDTIYIAIDFGNSDFDGRQANVEITISALTTENEIKPTQDFLMEFVNRYTMQTIESIGGIQQWQTPTDIQNFEEVDAGFRSIVTTSGTVSIMQSGGTVSVSYGDEKLFIIQNSGNMTNSPDPQTWKSADALNLTKVMSSTRSVSFQTYYDPSSPFCVAAMKAWFGGKADREKIFDLTFSVTGIGDVERKMVISNFQFSQEIGSFLTFIVAFTDADDGGN